jgi:hypothetical protein
MATTTYQLSTNTTDGYRITERTYDDDVKAWRERDLATVFAFRAQDQHAIELLEAGYSFEDVCDEGADWEKDCPPDLSDDEAVEAWLSAHSRADALDLLAEARVHGDRDLVETLGRFGIAEEVE